MSFMVALVGLVLALGGWVAVGRFGGSKTVGRALVSVIVLGTAGLVLTRESGQAPEDVGLLRPLEVREDGYVSSGTCGACHPREYASWYASYHRTMTQVATPESVVGPFEGVELDGVAGAMSLDRRGDEFWTTFRGASHPVALVTGSHHMQVYWHETGEGRRLGQLPYIYLFEAERWIPRRAAFLGPLDAPAHGEEGRWNRACIRCHTTHGKPRIRPREDMQTQVAEFGIACEACHGPALEHASENRNPLRRYRYHMGTERDPTLIQPEELSAPLSAQVCGQCHGIWEYFDLDDQLQGEVHGFPYRPGDDLDETRLVVRTAHVESGEPGPANLAAIRADPRYLADRFWSDGMVRVSGREYNGLIESPCFEGGEFSCTSCHRMHPSATDPRPLAEWAADQLGLGMDGDEACLQCHADFRERISEHSKHAVSSAGSRCYNCHMPYTTYGLLKAIRSHQVDSPDVTASVETGRPNACNQCHLDKPLGWAAAELEARYGIAPPELSRDQRDVAAGVLWALEGDAGQRALAAWSFGWEPAREASGSDWMGPYLAQLLDDPYEAVRYIAARSLKRDPAYQSLEFDFVGPPRQRWAAAEQVRDTWASERQGRADRALLLDPNGRLEVAEFLARFAARDETPVALRE